MFDAKKTIDLIKGGLLDSSQTWQSYLEEGHDWKDTATLLTGPLILASVLLSSLFGWVFSSHYMLPQGGGFWAFILGLIAATIGITVASFVFSYLAGVFKGKHDFNKGFAAVSLSAIPAYVGGVLGTLPLIGWLIALVLGIISLVFLYRIIPSYLQVPDGNRAIHYGVSLVSTIVIIFIINMILGFGAYSTGTLEQQSEQSNTGTEHAMMGEIGRQAAMMEKAEQDRYDPPKNGQVTEDQMAALILTMQKVSDYRKRQDEQMKELDEQMKDKKDFSFSDIGKMASGFNSVLSTVNAEMEVVKSGGGNWAEHQWVKNQLRTASIQKDLNDTVKHNYALSQKYSDQLSQYGVMY